MKKYKLLVLGNWSKLLTGFGGNKKRILRWFHAHPDWEVVEAAAGLAWDAPECSKMPWTCYGVAPDPQQQAQINSIQDEGQRSIAQRNANYGMYKIADVIKAEKPTHFFGAEDSWAFDDIVNQAWTENMPPVLHVTLDSLPFLSSQIDLAAKCKHLYPWANFATEEFHRLGYTDMETLPGTVDPNIFKPISQERRKELRQKFKIDDTNIFLFLGRSQLRKHFPNVMDGFKIFKEKNPKTKAKLLFHCSWKEGWNLPQLIKDKGLNVEDVLTTYYCRACRQWEIRSYIGEPVNCPMCGSTNTFGTSDIIHGPTDEEIAEIFGISDLVINAISSGGWELAAWQAKMCGKILATTSYSCGLDACYENSGGWPIEWSSYMEPGSQFIKATSCPKSISRCMERICSMDYIEKMNWENKALTFARNYCTTDTVCEKLRGILESIPPANWDNFSWEPKPSNPSYVPDPSLTHTNWLIDLHKHMLNDRCDKNTSYIKHWTAHLEKSNDREGTLQHFQNIAAQKNAQLNNKTVDFADLLDKDDEGKRIALICPQSAGDILYINSMMEDFKTLYPEFNIYFFTQPQFRDLIEHHPAIYKVLDYHPMVEDIFFMEGRGTHKGYFVAAFYPMTGTQHKFNYQHGELNFRAQWIN